MFRAIAVTASSLFFLASVTLTAHAESDLKPLPPKPSISGPAAGHIKVPPPVKTDLKNALKPCFPDPRTGQMICPQPTTPADGPEGAACSTDAGGKGLWVRKDGLSTKLLCAAPGEACYSSSGAIGKVFAAGDRMTCGAKGDYCVSTKGVGRVFLEKGALSCLALTESCTCANGTAGCKVVGLGEAYTTYTCAQRYVRCPTSPTPGVINLLPGNGQSTSAVPVTLALKPPRVDATSVTCEYQMTDTGKVASYAIPCYMAYGYNDTNRWRGCADASKQVTHKVACEYPHEISVSGKADSVLVGLGSGVAPSSAVTLSFKGSAADGAKQNAICNYGIDTFFFAAKVPCKSPTKATGNDYICN